MLLADFFLKQFNNFLIGGETERFCLGIDFFSVQVNFKSSARTFFFSHLQVEMFTNFICQTDSLVVIVSGNAIFNDNAIHGFSEV